MAKVLLIEDEDAFALLLAAYLGTAGYATERAGSAQAGLRSLERGGFDAIILDLNLPDEDGIALTRMLRARSAIPIIVATGRHGHEDKLAALEIGADDFVTKPFEPRELVLRLNNILRHRARYGRAGGMRLACAGGELDVAGHRLIAPSGACLDLSANEFSLLKLMARNPDCVLTRAQMIDACAGGEAPESERAVDIRISRLRRKLTQLGLDAALLRTVHGSGYKLVSVKSPAQPGGRVVTSRSRA
ncbi:response regulator transcription factor [Methylobacterium terricola]|nr:response regulator transcription factor [Methylobacterium terricola]